MNPNKVVVVLKKVMQEGRRFYILTAYLDV